ncbi:Endophilin-B2 SH3 domain-containing GRB2-like protein B2 [Takifugu flavidus]|uniref:Endophilin-B2 SH3 domain-containing GRB2-like protein B2 n=1 Tax=Takifugu flavidus TaxID=433684 RepID=A0A5C6NJM9_9TELE|nr:Endophilin-B2 SH3 domain-containing GRB2-like protein B2 [Takifugu flavidus]
MDFNVKKLASDAGVFFTRAVQFTEEKLGQAEKTELDPHLENLISRADATKNWTEKMLRQTEALLQPNPIDQTGKSRLGVFCREPLCELSVLPPHDRTEQKQRSSIHR